MLKLLVKTLKLYSNIISSLLFSYIKIRIPQFSLKKLFIEEGNEEIIAFGKNEDFKQYLKDNYDKTEFEVAKSTIMILEDMSKNAKYINDLRTEVVRDIYMTCRISRIRIAKIIEVRSFANKLSDMDALLEVVDFLDK